MTWQILEGQNSIPICLVEAVEKVDSGRVVLRDHILLEGHELHDEWRHLQGLKTIELCVNLIQMFPLPLGEVSSKEGSFYRRRAPIDSKLDPSETLERQFDLLRVVSNDRYPAFFEHRGQTYKLTIEKYEP